MRLNEAKPRWDIHGHRIVNHVQHNQIQSTVSKDANVTLAPVSSNDWQRRCCRAMRILAGFEIVLILATWPLWWRNGAFPVISLIDGFSLPLIADRVVVCILLVSCIHIACVPESWLSGKTVRRVAIVAALILSVDSQQRLQAWHWLFVLGLGASFFKPEKSLRLFRSILASVYVCSALSRMAPIAYHGMSAAIVDQLLGMSGIGREMTNAGMAEFFCQVLNIGELTVGLLLIWPRSRRYGILSAMALHGTLLVALGPLGLRHHNGVLLWNLCFLCLIPVVFSGPVADSNSSRTIRCWNYRAATILIWVFPLSGLIGFADNWPAWQLYSTRPESWILRIHEADIHYLDEQIRPYVSEAAPLDDWVVVRLDRWSLAETDSPLYPEDRFQCRIIRQVLGQLPDDAEFRVEISEPDQWFWWNRNHRTLTTRSQLNAEPQEQSRNKIL